jgi:hypothetical protein
MLVESHVGSTFAFEHGPVRRSRKDPDTGVDSRTCAPSPCTGRAGNTIRNQRMGDMAWRISCGWGIVEATGFRRGLCEGYRKGLKG